MSERFEEMVVLLTGGGTGIGRAAALAFGGEGARVVIGGLERPELEATRAELTDRGVLARAPRVDVRDDQDVTIRRLVSSTWPTGSPNGSGSISVSCSS